jgi:hypothetical protein
MRTYGQRWCDELTRLNPASESALGATYYDAEKIFYEMAAWFPAEAAKWNACAQRAEVAYRDNFVRTTGGALPGYWIFTDGLRRDYELTRDAISRSAVDLLAKYGSFCADGTPLEWSASASLMREDSYCLNAYLDNEALGAGLTSRAPQMLTQLLDHLDATITLRYKAEQDADVPDVCKGKTYAQPFYMGLAMKTLIEWDSVHPDSRILPMMKRVADFLWDKLRYNPASATQGARFWYGQCATSAGSWNVWTTAGGNLPADDLNLLFAPGYAWLYSKTGSTVYRDRGDQIWTVGVNDATQNGLNSKQFNQNYMWSFDYVRRR